MDFPLYFQKVIRPRYGFILGGKKILKKPNTLEYAQVLVVRCRKLKLTRAF